MDHCLNVVALLIITCIMISDIHLRVQLQLAVSSHFSDTGTTSQSSVAGTTGGDIYDDAWAEPRRTDERGGGPLGRG